MAVTLEDLERRILANEEKLESVIKRLETNPGRADLDNLKAELQAGLSEDRKILAMLKAKHDAARGPGENDPERGDAWGGPFL